LLDAAGIDVPKEMQGRSIMPLVRKQSVDWPDDLFVQISESHVGRCIRTKRWKYSVRAPDKDGWNDAASDTYVEDFLYDLQSDPHELKNLAGFKSHSAVSEVLRSRLIERMTAAGEHAPHIVPAPEVESGQRRVAPEEAHQ
jgi:arylsulfatase A-like enzyme